MAIIQYDELSSIRERHIDKKIVFCSGCFDLTHPGHVLFFERIKELGDILVVMVGNDSVIRDYKGPDRPIMNQALRSKMVESLKPVDYAFLERPMRNSPHDPLLTPQQMLETLIPVFEQLRPDVYAVNSDGFDLEHRRTILRGLPTELAVLERAIPDNHGFEGEFSTTAIIQKIKELS